MSNLVIKLYTKVFRLSRYHKGEAGYTNYTLKKYWASYEVCFVTASYPACTLDNRVVRIFGGTCFVRMIEESDAKIFTYLLNPHEN